LAENPRHGTIGLCSLGPVRDGGTGFEGEVYTLYVDPAFIGRGAGRALLASAFDAFKARRLRSCLIWAHARNNACFFYEAMGGRRVATRTTRLMGELTPEIGFGWKQLAAKKQTRTIQS
jgi:ribosomal protein S18 acetylase RimI-like enzyme